MQTEPASGRDHREVDLGDVAAVTDRGRRHPDNQDAVTLRSRGGRVVWAVCDGVSTSQRPEVAADVASQAAGASLVALLGLPAWPDTDEVVAAVEAATAAAERAVLTLAEPSDPISATTVVLGALGPRVAVIGSVGDSRAYWIAAGEGEHRLLTRDDSWAEQAIREGIPPAEAHASRHAHVITRCLRTDARDPTPPNLTVLQITGPGYLVVCSDGLWNYFEPAASLAAALAASPDPTPIGIARHLVESANLAGGADNITVAVIPTPAPEA